MSDGTTRRRLTATHGGQQFPTNVKRLRRVIRSLTYIVRIGYFFFKWQSYFLRREKYGTNRGELGWAGWLCVSLYVSFAANATTICNCQPALVKTQR